MVKYWKVIDVEDRLSMFVNKIYVEINLNKNYNELN